MQTTAAEDKPVIALAMGDPPGISPELTAKVFADDAVRAKACLLAIGDRRVSTKARALPRSSRKSKRSRPTAKCRPGSAGRFLSISAISIPPARRGVASRQGGEFALANYHHALTLARDGYADAVCFTPF